MKIPFIPCALIAGFIAASGPAHAAIVASGLRDIVISTTFDGVYLNVDTGTTSGTETAGWDINPFFGGEGIATSPDFQPVRATIALDAPVLSLTAGQTVDGSLNFLTGYGGSESHIGNSAGQFAANGEAYIGFRFTTDGSEGPFYGWMRVVLSNDGSTGMIRDWAYDNTGSAITVGAVPEPSVLCTLLAGTGLFFLRRRK